jgi:hypothetical protein
MFKREEAINVNIAVQPILKDTIKISFLYKIKDGTVVSKSYF